MSNDMFKQEDIRPQALIQNQKQALLADVESLKSRRESFTEVPCPACGSTKFSSCYEKYGMQHVHCNDCDTQYISPRPTPEILQDFYRNSQNYAYWAKHIFPATAETRRERIFKPRAQLIAKLAQDYGFPTNTIFEIGSAYGLFCEEMQKLGLFKRVIGVEPTPDLAQICRDKGIEVLEAFIEDVELDQQPEVVVNFEVIEHLIDPKGFMDSCYKILAPGGFLVLTCPNIAGFETQILGKHSGTVDHEHLNYFSPSSISLLAKSCGFTVVDVQTPGVLDCDIVYEYLNDSNNEAVDVDPLIRKILFAEDASARDSMQLALQKAKLSSNMMLIARKD